MRTPLIMGIINITKDSFYKGSRKFKPEDISNEAQKMVQEGVDIIDLGAMSTRPGAKEVDLKTEIELLEMACESVRNTHPDVMISIDTYRVEVLQALEKYRVNMVNDITGGTSEDMYHWAGNQRVPYVCMHMKGTASTMNTLNQYEDMMKEIMDYFIDRIPKIRKAGVQDILLDPGFGFAKNADQNFSMLKNLQVFQILELPVLVGISRKSMIWRTLGIDPDHALNGTTALHMIALQKGAKILRVHDVKAARQVISLWQKLESDI